MKKGSIIIFDATTADYSEVVDSIADGLEVIIIAEEYLGDGFQWTDILGGVEAQPKVSEIINDAETFWEQFQKLNPETAIAATLEARQRIINSGKTFGKVSGFVIKSLYLSATTYGEAVRTYQAGQRQVMLFQSLIGGGPVFPDEFVPA